MPDRPAPTISTSKWSDVSITVPPQDSRGRACPGHPRLAWIATVKAWKPGTSPGVTKRSSFRGDAKASNPESRGRGARHPMRIAHLRFALASQQDVEWVAPPEKREI